MSKNTIVTFVKNWRGYAAGETAGFALETANALFEGEYAVKYKEGGEVSGKQSKTPAAKPAAAKSAKANKAGAASKPVAEELEATDSEEENAESSEDETQTSDDENQSETLDEEKP